MAGTYTELYYHLVWRTKESEPFITEALEPHLYAYIRSRCAALGVFVHALDGVSDHAHLACSIPPSLSIAELLKQLKGSSSHFVNGIEPFSDPTVHKRPQIIEHRVHQRDAPAAVRLRVHCSPPQSSIFAENVPSR